MVTPTCGANWSQRKSRQAGTMSSVMTLNWMPCFSNSFSSPLLFRWDVGSAAVVVLVSWGPAHILSGAGSDWRIAGGQISLKLQSLGDRLVWNYKGVDDRLVWNYRGVGDRLVWNYRGEGDGLVWNYRGEGDRLVWNFSWVGDRLVWNYSAWAID